MKIEKYHYLNAKRNVLWTAWQYPLRKENTAILEKAEERVRMKCAGPCEHVSWGGEGGPKCLLQDKMFPSLQPEAEGNRPV